MNRTHEVEMSENLKAFLSAYLDWIDKGALEDESFTRRYGLCSNFDDFLVNGNFSYDEIGIEVGGLKKSFIEDGLDDEYPFGGYDQYGEEMENETLHLNPARLAWVRSKVTQYEAA